MFLDIRLLCHCSPSLSLNIGPPLPLPSVGTYVQRCAWWILSTGTLNLLPAPEAFGTVQSIAGARAEGHPVRVTSGLHHLSPVPWCVTVGMQEKVSGQEDGWTLCKYCAVTLAKRPSGPLTEWGCPWVTVLSGSLCKGDNMLFDFVSSLSSLSLDFRVIYLSSLPPRWIILSNLPDLPSCQVLKAMIVG
ncbi:hypothetical protein DFH94DRAFT_685319 [Russula ochroleuca]|uniref:Uncharacterized protein n=1 Tax=Russula ochroleuca TaxID=152965 RepID=A0A9P5MQJ6_9AGAM|nr:hypothetical protein DFH94DRAFT_685319 [Russula ochroleuca]